MRAEDLRTMLGLADRSRIIELFDALMRGDAAGALKELRDQYDFGADPAVAMIDLADFTHFVTRVKIVPSVADDPAFSEAERTRARTLAAGLSMRVLSRTWQMLFKGIADVQAAPKPLAAAEMVLVRIAYAADLPAPEEVIRSLGEGSDTPARTPSGNGGASVSGGSSSRPPLQQARGSPAPMRSPAPTTAPRAQLAAAQAQQPAVDQAADEAAPLVVGRFEDLINLAAERRDLQLKASLERDVRLVRFEDGKLEIALETGASKALVHDIARKLSLWTNRRWMVVVSAEAGAATLRAQAEARQQELQTGVAADPLVQAVLNRFPGSQIVGVRARGAPEEPPPLLDVPPVDDESTLDTELMPDDDSDDD